MILGKEIEEKIKERVSKILKEENLDLVDFKIFPQGGSFIVKITADFPYGGVTLKDLSFVNKIIFSYLEKENILGEDFVVEVVSPGLDRKLKEKSDFLRVLGKYLKIWLKSPYEGKNYYEGILEKIEEENLIIKSEKIISIPLFLINFAKQKIE